MKKSLADLADEFGLTIPKEHCVSIQNNTKSCINLRIISISSNASAQDILDALSNIADLTYEECEFIIDAALNGQVQTIEVPLKSVQQQKDDAIKYLTTAGFIIG